MAQVTLEQAERNLADLVRQAQGGEEVLITRVSGDALEAISKVKAVFPKSLSAGLEGYPAQ